MNQFEHNQIKFNIQLTKVAKKFQIEDIVLQRAVDAKLTCFINLLGTPIMKKFWVLESLYYELSKKNDNEDIKNHLYDLISKNRRCVLD